MRFTSVFVHAPSGVGPSVRRAARGRLIDRLNGGIRTRTRGNEFYPWLGLTMKRSTAARHHGTHPFSVGAFGGVFTVDSLTRLPPDSERRKHDTAAVTVSLLLLLLLLLLLPSLVRCRTSLEEDLVDQVIQPGTGSCEGIDTSDIRMAVW